MDSQVYPKDCLKRQVWIDPNLCFILSPFKREYGDIREAAERCGFQPVRADDILEPGIIHSDMWDRIQRAAVIIADVTEHNPNVFFELGVAAAVKDKSRVIIIRQPNAGDEYPFDIGPFRCIHYDDSVSGRRKLTEHLEAYLRTIRREDDDVWVIRDKMDKWRENEYEYEFLLKRPDLKHMKRSPWTHKLDREISAYALASALVYACDVRFWTDLNKDNVEAAKCLAHLMLGAYRHPRLRAAYALQHMHTDVRMECVRGVSTRGGTDRITHRMLEGIQSSTVKQVVEEEAGKGIDVEVAQVVLREFERWDVL